MIAFGVSNLGHPKYFASPNVCNEDMGLGWDPAWSQERITHIVENYKKFALVVRQ